MGHSRAGKVSWPFICVFRTQDWWVWFEFLAFSCVRVALWKWSWRQEPEPRAVLSVGLLGGSVPSPATKRRGGAAKRCFDLVLLWNSPSLGHPSSLLVSSLRTCVYKEMPGLFLCSRACAELLLKPRHGTFFCFWFPAMHREVPLRTSRIMSAEMNLNYSCLCLSSLLS